MLANPKIWSNGRVTASPPGDLNAPSTNGRRVAELAERARELPTRPIRRGRRLNVAFPKSCIVIYLKKR